ncbi:superoxide dismutase family protein [Geodermatophilus sabuli]|uniref:Superoxide dismutase [Cu-Zn] n=1 Tax=Geodermatophilus sabuli TaxID=1564158 RepID=A0A285EHK8_9ACTN|nr:superoxide dismutase family protein [Geodermatophilus sabuli]MBB3083974.1 Cu-Zn family superoxide dismutase [Geodermatophilus sabuli]SNX98622.1 superoxide dismutase, Cu-Zn family [Geodermatophilus sabuli]
MRRTVALAFACPCVVPLLLVGGCAADDGAAAAPDVGGGAGAADPAEGEEELTARLVDPEGGEVGTAVFREVEGGLQVKVEVDGLPAGFHGFHVHAVGLCEPDSTNPADPSMTGDFLSAGGHLGAGTADHGEHAGDLPVLFVDQTGAGSLAVVTDALTRADLTDDDGSAVMVHAGRDNYANVPERYAPDGPDEMTRNTGDAGGRIACGPVEG